MHLALLNLALTALIYTGISTAHPLEPPTPHPAPLLPRAKTTSYSCAGSSSCNYFVSSPLSWACNSALTKINPDAIYKTGGSKRDTGECAKPLGSVFGCGIFVSGDGCSRTGAQMIQAVSDIRSIGGCVVCGWAREEDGDGCKVKIDYVGGC